MAGWLRVAGAGLALWAALSPLSAAAQGLVRVAAEAPALVAGMEAAADGYVESRLRPLREGAGEGRLYVVGRHRDAGNWYGAGLGFNPATGRMQVEIVRMRDGALTRLKQFGREAAADDRFYTVRLELSGTTLAVYLNGERITSVADTTLPRLPGGYGLYASGAAFEASAPVTGDAALKPARLALARAPQRVHLQAGEAALRLPVSAFGAFRAADPSAGPGVATAAGAPAGGASFVFTARAADPALLRAEVDGGHVTLFPLAAGVTSLTLASVEDPNVFSVVDVVIGERAPARAAGYKLAGAVTPAIGERDVPYDTPLRLRFDQPPTLGRGGAIRVLRKRDGALVDTIRTAGEYDLLGYEGQEYRRAVRRQPVVMEGRTVVIHPHSARLRPGEEYLVTVDDGVFAGTLEGQPFTGVAATAGWTFRTRAAVPRGARLTVDDDGTADFRTVQGALNHAMRHVKRATPVTIAIRDGRYRELLFLRGKDRVTLRGQSRDGVVIDAVNADGLNPGSGASQAAGSPGIGGGRAIFLVEDADLLTLDTLTIRNSALRASPAGGQAEALFFASEGRLIAKNASFFSEQDTIQVRGYSWFYRTLIAGNVDFVWGNNRAALFEDGELRTVGDSANGKGGGYLVQARTLAASDKGFVFLNSRLTHGPGPTGNDVPAGATWLARSPGYETSWDHVAFINCRMGPHIAPAGWAGKGVARQPAPNPAAGSAGAGWREHGSMDLAGRPLDLGAREHVRLLTVEEARAQFGGRALIFAGYGGGRGWRPTLRRAE